jgi:thiol-disulfide isomerase/thioredoxin
MTKAKTYLKSCMAVWALMGMLQTSFNAFADEADDLWEKVQSSSQVRPYPTEWQTNQPTQEQVATFQKENSEMTFKAATLAREFITQFPVHAKVSDAEASEKQMLRAALEFGHEKAADKLLKLDLPDTERFQVRSIIIQQKAMAKQSEGREAVLLTFEKGVRELEKEFPDNAEIPQMLLYIAENLGGVKGKEIAAKLAESASDEQIKAAARSLLEKLSLPGSKIDIKFTAVDGREVDVQKMNGKVVLIDFWATWCGPCVAELPNVKAAYDRLHPKGFEIVGISFDNTKGKLTSFVKKEKMAWPQYFVGQGWQNAFGQRFGIQSIPAMWLVNKKGELVDMNARQNLVEKVEALLAEK